MPKKRIYNQGFTLLEVIMSIVIITIIGVFAGRGLVEIAKGYTLSRKNAIVAQQGQITLARINKELSASVSLECGGSKMITYKIKRDGESEDTATIYWAGEGAPLLLKTGSNCIDCTACAGGDILAENVSDFALSYCKTTTTNCSSTFLSDPDDYEPVSLIKIRLGLKGYDDTPILIADPDIVFLGLDSGS
jgi:prepilin-type N-terminal cleavage/methylation domain-containing protein